MSTLLSQSIPIFESGYPLRVDDLDNMFNYLDDNERHSRICLIGAGIFYGLDVSVEAGPTLKIAAGAGVTSQGYLYCDKEPKSFTKYKLLDKYSSAYLTNTNNWMEGDVTPLLSKSLIKPKAPTPFDLTGVLELVENDGKALLRNDLVDRVVVIVFERTSEKRNGCTTCNKGTNGNVTLRYLLVKKEEWNRVSKCDLLPIESNPITLQFPYLERFSLRGVCAQNFSFASSALLNGRYQTVVASAIDRLFSSLNMIVDSFALVFNRKIDDDKKNVKNGTDWVKTNPISKQYSYDYTKHLIQAYTEFAENLFVQSTALLPPEMCFPKYLTLARLDVPAVSSTIELLPIEVHTDVRLPFYRPPFANTSVVFDEAKFLYERLMTLLDAANLLFDRRSTHENDPTDIKITPSSSLLKPLSNRAIPYYFNGGKLRSSWHFSLAKTNRTKSISAYDRESGAPFDEPFLYQNSFDNADFYRIEGHIHKNLGMVWNRLVGDVRNQSVGLRTCLNLPFSVEIVELLSNTEGAKPIFTSLESFAEKHTGLEHQGGVMRGGTLILVVERISANITGIERDLTDVQKRELSHYKVVADFCLPYWVVEKPRKLPAAIFKELSRTPFNLETRSTQIVFQNLSVNNDSIEWYINDVLITTGIDGTGNLTHSFGFDDDKQAERTFVVTLIAKSNDDDLPLDMSTQGVFISQTVFEKPLADFELVSRVPLKGTQTTLQTGEIITFENRSDHADTFVWSVVGETTLVPTVTGDKASFNLPFRVLPYRIRLRATNAASLLFDEAEQDVFVTAEKVEPPVADFEMTKRKPFLKGETQIGETITFENRSDHADKFTWSVKPEVKFQTKVNDKDKLIADFLYNSEQDYIVQLVVENNAVSLALTNTATLQVSVMKAIDKVDLPVADFAELDRRYTFVGRELSGVVIEYENRSDHADVFSWEIWVLSSGQEKELIEAKSRLNSNKTNFTVPFTLVEMSEQTYKIKLIANPQQPENDQTNFAVAEQLIIFNNAIAFGASPVDVITPVEGETNPSDAIVDEMNLRSLVATTDIPTVDGLTASRNLEARRRDFYQKVQDEGAVNDPLSKLTSYQNVLSFMTDFDKAVAAFDRSGALHKGFDKLDSFDKAFKTNALQMVQNIKKEGSMPDAVYRNVLRNLLFFYLDKLVHLLPDKLTATTKQTIADVLAKIKEEQSFGTESLDDLRKAWQVADITTIQNVPVTEQLNSLFEL